MDPIESVYADDIIDDEVDEVAVDASLGEMCLKTVELLRREAKLVEDLEKVRKNLKVYTEKLIPAQMQTMHLEELRTPGGLRIEIVNEVRASLPKDERREQAFEYLRRTNNEGLIRTSFEVSFGVGTDELAKKFAALIRENKIDEVAEVFDSKTINHAQMLKFLRDQLKAGVEVPMETFGAIVQTFAKVSLVSG